MLHLPKSNLSRRGKTIMLALTGVFTSLVIAGAFIEIPTPLVSFTMQTFFVQLTSSMMGPLWGGITIALYIFMGLVGIPVFTKGGGFMYVLQPTFGYLIGFFIGTIVGALIIKMFKKKSYWAYLTGNIVNLLITYACGMIYFYFIQTFYFGKSVTAYTIFISLFLIFMPSDLLFTFVASYVALKLKPILNKTIYQVASDEDIAKFEAEQQFEKLKDNDGQKFIPQNELDSCYSQQAENSPLTESNTQSTISENDNQVSVNENNYSTMTTENNDCESNLTKDNLV